MAADGMTAARLTEVEQLAREARALPGIRLDCLMRIVTLALHQLREDRQQRETEGTR